jgi:hydroxymethylbilane synthase
LAALEGSCKVPVAGHARLEQNRITLKGLVANLSGSTVVTAEMSGDPEKARELGIALGQELIRQGAGAILAEISQHGSSR